MDKEQAFAFHLVDQYKSFLEKAVANNYGRDILKKIIYQGAENEAAKPSAAADHKTESASTNLSPTQPQISAAQSAKSSATDQSGSNEPSGKSSGGAAVKG